MIERNSFLVNLELFADLNAGFFLGQKLCNLHKETGDELVLVLNHSWCEVLCVFKIFDTPKALSIF